MLNDEQWDEELLHHAPPQDLIPENGFQSPQRRVPELDSRLDASGGGLNVATYSTWGTCPECKKYFDRLDRHVLTHTGERPYKCKLCPKRFRQRVHLVRHFNVHQRKSHFPCMYCDKVLTRKDKLKDHMARTCKVLHGTEMHLACPQSGVC